MTPDRLADAILEHIDARPGGRTVSPSDVAKTLAAQAGTPDDWRAWLKPVGAAARGLAASGRIALYRKGKPVDDPATAKGVLRLGPPPEGPTTA
ncbi:DUF3253 domain-containing protein [Roseospira marina]|uniref:DUF3253 domain-containing protein n=1 Tax=Roseospira marina TaxID=140057 RepID=UPI001478C31D|nr:DUF3253 domain-containing protein [Roseospira marina]MBB4315365.1 hypothetical protein [Roseospira marina]MBB5088364.1 hypothetical protein [Roseospira marina]